MRVSVQTTALVLTRLVAAIHKQIWPRRLVGGMEKRHVRSRNAVDAVSSCHERIRASSTSSWCCTDCYRYTPCQACGYQTDSNLGSNMHRTTLIASRPVAWLTRALIDPSSFKGVSVRFSETCSTGSRPFAAHGKSVNLSEAYVMAAEIRRCDLDHDEASDLASEAVLKTHNNLGETSRGKSSKSLSIRLKPPEPASCDVKNPSR
jgi:hypothetical protein